MLFAFKYTWITMQWLKKQFSNPHIVATCNQYCEHLIIFSTIMFTWIMEGLQHQVTIIKELENLDLWLLHISCIIKSLKVKFEPSKFSWNKFQPLILSNTFISEYIPRMINELSQRTICNDATKIIYIYNLIWI